MKLPAYQLLKYLVKYRDITLDDVDYILPKILGDFRDWYSVAGLIKQGYMGCMLTEEAIKSSTERELASLLYAQTLGNGRHKVNNMTAINDNNTKDTAIFYATSKCDLYFAELNAKRFDRFISVVIAIFIAFSSAIIAVYIKEFFQTASK